MLKVKKEVELVKKLIISFLVISLAWFSWIFANISESNSILSVVGVKTNSGQEAKLLKSETLKLRAEKAKLTSEVAKISKQIENKNYTRFSEEIRDIRSQQISWFDKTNADGQLEFGLIDAVPRMQKYFNSRAYHDPSDILSGIHGEVKINNLQVSRDGLSFSVDSSQILGKVFYLNIEFIEMINSFPFLKNGDIQQFSRQKNETDDDSMKFSVRLDRQLENEEDPYDIRFQEYLDWLAIPTATKPKN